MNDITIEKSRQTNPADTLKKLECLKLEHGLFIRELTGVVVEKELRIYLNGNYLVTAAITPDMVKEFITGYLFGQGFINGSKELESISIESNTVYATMSRAEKMAVRAQKTSYRVVSGGGRAAYFGDTEYPEVRSDLKIGKQVVFTAMNMLFEKAEIYKATEGVHGAGLFTAEAEPICIVEDIGRHNCLDKIIGYALINDIDCPHTLLVSTGRMASEMVAKICRAEIPVAATKTAMTDKGLEIARKCGMTIIGFVRDTGTSINTDMETRTITEAGMKIYTHAERIRNGRK